MAEQIAGARTIVCHGKCYFRTTERGQFLISATLRSASSGDTKDGSDNRGCPSSDARRSTPPSSSSPPASAPPKPLSLNPPWKRAVYPKSKARISNRSSRIRKSFPDPIPGDMKTHEPLCRATDRPIAGLIRDLKRKRAVNPMVPNLF